MPEKVKNGKSRKSEWTRTTARVPVYGWVCPICQKVYSPRIDSCKQCSPEALVTHLAIELPEEEKVGDTIKAVEKEAVESQIKYGEQDHNSLIQIHYDLAAGQDKDVKVEVPTDHGPACPCEGCVETTKRLADETKKNIPQYVRFDPELVGWTLGLVKAVQDAERMNVPLCVRTKELADKIHYIYPLVKCIVEDERA